MFQTAKSVLKKNKIVFLILLILLLGFYWFPLRPSIIYKTCDKEASDKAIDLFKTKVEIAPGDPSELEKAMVDKKLFYKNDYNSLYETCLHKKGLR